MSEAIVVVCSYLYYTLYGFNCLDFEVRFGQFFEKIQIQNTVQYLELVIVPRKLPTVQVQAT
jgi:hypothetical protein